MSGPGTHTLKKNVPRAGQWRASCLIFCTRVQCILYYIGACRTKASEAACIGLGTCSLGWVLRRTRRGSVHSCLSTACRQADEKEGREGRRTTAGGTKFRCSEYGKARRTRVAYLRCIGVGVSVATRGVFVVQEGCSSSWLWARACTVGQSGAPGTKHGRPHARATHGSCPWLRCRRSQGCAPAPPACAFRSRA